MTDTLVMFDSATNSSFPDGAPAYAAYVDGREGDQPNYEYIRSAFPSAFHHSIALDPAADAQCLDIENGAADPKSAAGWYEQQRARGVARPCLYASVSVMEAQVVPVITAAGIPRSAVRLWTAHTEAGEHICGPRSCGQLSIDADGTQWTFTAMGRTLDQSLLRADFFGPAIKAPPPGFGAKLLKVLPDARRGTTGTTARTVQGLLCARGHAVVIDGTYGPATGLAVRAFQEMTHTSADGVVGPETWPLLAGTIAEVSGGAAGPVARTVQGLLCARGQAVTIDGTYGPRTAAAVNAIQVAARIRVDGVAGPVTWGVLLTARPA